jgi:hypothetical protein
MLGLDLMRLCVNWNIINTKRPTGTISSPSLPPPRLFAIAAKLDAGILTLELDDEVVVVVDVVADDDESSVVDEPG